MFGYIGSFPPPFGGVTVKNDIWFNELNKEINIIKINFPKKQVLLTVFFLKILYCRGFVIGIGSNNKRIMVTKLLAKWFPKKIKSSIIFIMGGEFGNVVLENSHLVKYFSKYRGVFVELESMQEILNSVGLKNVYCLPNCRKRPFENYNIRKCDGRLRCVIFSMIFPEKGIDIILEAAGQMPDVDFFFWGEIKKEYENIFLKQIEQYENCFYCGVYKNGNGEVYGILNQYDLLLFPTRWKAEGMPGTLIESKIAGVPAVVSRHAYNTELITHMYDGIVMASNDLNGLISAIQLLDENRNLLMELKRNVKDNSEKYFIDRYINDVKDILSKK